MHLLFWLVLSLCTQANADSFKIQRATAVFKEPSPNSKIRLYLSSGETVQLLDEPNGNYVRIKFMKKGRWRSGYVKTADMPQLMDDEGFDEFDRQWALGLGGVYSWLKQSARTFATDDSVTYETTDYESLSISPFIFLQMGREDFWRLIVAYKRVRYESTATSNVSGASSKALEVNSNFVSGLLERVWQPFAWKVPYLGVGMEIAKSLDTQVRFADADLQTDKTDRPIYVIPTVILGFTGQVGKSWGWFVEGRYGIAVNQDPPVTSTEAAFGLLYWP